MRSRSTYLPQPLECLLHDDMCHSSSTANHYFFAKYILLFAWYFVVPPSPPTLYFSFFFFWNLAEENNSFIRSAPLAGGGKREKSKVLIVPVEQSSLLFVLRPWRCFHTGASSSPLLSARVQPVLSICTHLHPRSRFRLADWDFFFEKSIPPGDTPPPPYSVCYRRAQQFRAVVFLSLPPP
eukprot:Hpha_TRINITY_DN15815_c2_g9::TRINITY_DN15815_c2_g9_i2::g.189654::m.189654